MKISFPPRMGYSIAGFDYGVYLAVDDRLDWACPYACFGSTEIKFSQYSRAISLELNCTAGSHEPAPSRGNVAVAVLDERETTG